MTNSKKRFAQYTLTAMAITTALTTYTQARMFGLDVYAGASIPLSSETRDMLGSTWINYGISPTLPFFDMYDDSCEKKASFGPAVEFSAQSKHKNKFFIVRPSISAKLRLASRNAHFCPYVSASVGPAYVSYRLVRNNVLLKRRRIGFGGKAEIGAHIAKKWKVGFNAEYYNKTDGVSFDTVGLTLTYSIL